MDASLAAWGMRRESDVVLAREAIFFLWPENVDTWRIWNRVQTQWRDSMMGRTGLDYTAVTGYMRDVARVKDRDFAHKFMCIQAMERAALDEWEKKREQ